MDHLLFKLGITQLINLHSPEGFSPTLAQVVSLPSFFSPELGIIPHTWGFEGKVTQRGQQISWYVLD